MLTSVSMLALQGSALVLLPTTPLRPIALATRRIRMVAPPDGDDGIPFSFYEARSLLAEKTSALHEATIREVELRQHLLEVEANAATLSAERALLLGASAREVCEWQTRRDAIDAARAALDAECAALDAKLSEARKSVDDAGASEETRDGLADAVERLAGAKNVIDERTPVTWRVVRAGLEERGEALAASEAAHARLGQEVTALEAQCAALEAEKASLTSGLSPAAGGMSAAQRVEELRSQVAEVLAHGELAPTADAWTKAQAAEAYAQAMAAEAHAAKSEVERVQSSGAEMSAALAKVQQAEARATEAQAKSKFLETRYKVAQYVG